MFCFCFDKTKTNSKTFYFDRSKCHCKTKKVLFWFCPKQKQSTKSCRSDITHSSATFGVTIPPKSRFRIAHVLRGLWRTVNKTGAVRHLHPVKSIFQPDCVRLRHVGVCEVDVERMPVLIITLLQTLNKPTASHRDQKMRRYLLNSPLPLNSPVSRPSALAWR